MTPDVHPPRVDAPYFVYGTLLEGFQNDQRLMAPYCVRRHPAVIEGVALWHLTEYGYPILTHGQGSVRGELVWLDDWAARTPELDALEGYTGDPEDSSYIRALSTVHDLQEDAPVDAHIYWFNGDPEDAGSEAIRVYSGDWRSFMAHRDLDQGTQILSDTPDWADT